MRGKLFTLSRSHREDMWRRFKQTDDRRVTERLHAILLLGSGQNANAVSRAMTQAEAEETLFIAQPFHGALGTKPS